MYSHKVTIISLEIDHNGTIVQNCFSARYSEVYSFCREYVWLTCYNSNVWFPAWIKLHEHWNNNIINKSVLKSFLLVYCSVVVYMHEKEYAIAIRLAEDDIVFVAAHFSIPSVWMGIIPVTWRWGYGSLLQSWNMQWYVVDKGVVLYSGCENVHVCMYALSGCIYQSTCILTLYPPVTIIIFHKPIRIYMGSLILGVNTLYMLFCF